VGRALAARRVLAIATGILLFHFLVALAVVPPWQHPDEPVHLLFSRILAGQTSFDLSQRTDPVLEREIVASMAEHGWWRHYGRPVPDSLPPDLTRVGLAVVDSGPTTYYVLAAILLRTLGVDTLLGQLHALRWLSALLGVLTLWCGWAGTRRLFGLFAADVTVLAVALLPQFALASTAAGPGALVTFCGAVVWRQAGPLLAGEHRAGVLVWLAAGVAAVSKREGLPLLAMAAVVTLFSVARIRIEPGLPRRVLRAAGVAAVLSLLVTVFLQEEVVRISDTLPRLLDRPMDPESRSWAYFRRFSVTLLDSAWLYGGWMRYPAPTPWMMTVRLLVIVSGGGLMWLIWRGGWRPHWRPVAVAVLFVAIQGAAIYVVHFRLHIGPQGRYLFPVLFPAMAVFWVGLRSWWSTRTWPLVATALVVILLLLDLTGWGTLLIPTYVG